MKKEKFERIFNFLKQQKKEQAYTSGELIIGDNKQKKIEILDTENNKDTNLKNLYDLASISKLFITAIILQLIEDNFKNISLDDKIYKFLPNFKSSNLTILDLLTHRVDFGIALGELRNKWKENFNNELTKYPVEINKINKTNYQNLGFIYLGKILEKIFERKIDVILIDFFKKLELFDTYTGNNLPQNYIYKPTEIINEEIIIKNTHDETARLMGGIAGNAGIFATTLDLFKFGQKWLNYEIVSDDFF